MIQFFGYKKCSTCRKAEKFLQENHLSFKFVDIVETPPSVEQLQKAFEHSELPIKKWFNTSGQLYREMGLKTQVDKMSEAEIFKLMAQHGKLIKRPLAFDSNSTTIGYREEEYQRHWLK